MIAENDYKLEIRKRELKDTQFQIKQIEETNKDLYLENAAMNQDIKVIADDIEALKHQIEKYGFQNKEKLRKIDNEIEGKQEVLRCIQRETEKMLQDE